MTASQRIEHILNIKKTSKKEFAEAVGININTLSKMFQNKTDPKLPLIQSCLEQFPSLNAHWLVTGKGEVWLKKKSDVREVNVKQLDDMQSQIDEIIEWMRAEQAKSN